MKRYNYVGPADIQQTVAPAPLGTPITSYQDFDAWMRAEQSARSRLAARTVTFVVDEAGILRLADRHSEHVACAGGKLVLAAGEMTFILGRGGWGISEISNQSTGYCPEPESWSAVEDALEPIAIPHPGSFTTVCIFRRCPHCRQIAIVKDDMYRCEVCGSALPREWNLASS